MLSHYLFRDRIFTYSFMDLDFNVHLFMVFHQRLMETYWSMLGINSYNLSYIIPIFALYDFSYNARTHILTIWLIDYLE